MIAVDLKDTDSGWWVGTNTRTGEAGLFPGSHVEEIQWTQQEAEVFEVGGVDVSALATCLYEIHLTQR